MRKARNRTSYRPKAWRERGGEVGRKYDNVVKSESIMLPSFPDNLEGISKRNCKKRTREEKTGKKQKKQQKKKSIRHAHRQTSFESPGPNGRNGF